MTSINHVQTPTDLDIELLKPCVSYIKKKLILAYIFITFLTIMLYRLLKQQIIQQQILQQLIFGYSDNLAFYKSDKLLALKLLAFGVCLWPNIVYYINLPLQSIPSAPGGHKHVPLFVSHDPPFLHDGIHIRSEKIDTNNYETVSRQI